jgi:dolichol-phosphate mannosyltransferase
MRALYFKEKMRLVSPEISRDLIYIDDVIDAYLSINRLKKHGGDVINIGTGVQSSIKEVVETAVRVTGETTDFRWGEMEKRAWDTAYWVADISRARQLLGWHPSIMLEKGLFLMWNWYKNNRQVYPVKPCDDRKL